ncbi:MAG: reductive dehalogenase [Dehalococcoides mccartyi]|uniref:reductive dehalogenase n=1 Tax=Dehalococcoides mccartyi TaxID=61435 RepID=UPI0008054D04|nr:reductive dehalogenase [Dehalococcoides mccartyi]OBW62520.1 MAG: reductive dehalogenase [Dehalococcoides mccartyi]
MKQHSTISRRDFMKGLGVAGAGIGAATATAPIFHDLDEILASPSASFKRPWWVKERDFGNPTCEIDWNQIKRMDNSQTLHGVTTWSNLIGPEKVKTWAHDGGVTERENIKNNVPGNTLKDVALLSAVGSAINGGTSFVQNPVELPDPDMAPPIYLWAGAPSPEYFGATKYQGTPEENSQMMRAAMRFMGASQVGFAELGENEKKLIFTRHARIPKNIVFEAEDKGYETSDKFVIPDKPMWVISISIQMSKELFRQGRSILRTCGNGSRYYVWVGLQARAQAFLNGLGYQGLGYPFRFWGLMPSIADAVLTGLAETSRNSNVCISPEYGTVVGYFSMLTDLPLAPTKPIDAGIFRFCHTCRKCADACPVQAISHDSEPSWDIPRSALSPNAEPAWTTGGKKVFHRDDPLCFTTWQPPFCGVCMGTCTFNTNDVASVHEFVKSTVSTTSLLNGFLWKADSFFGYGLTPDEDKENWWNHDLPTYGYDTTISAYDGGYSKR